MRREELEQRIREGYDIIKQCETKKYLSDEPKEQARHTHTIKEQWQHVAADLTQYHRLNGTVPADIADIVRLCPLPLPPFPFATPPPAATPPPDHQHDTPAAATIYIDASGSHGFIYQPHAPVQQQYTSSSTPPPATPPPPTAAPPAPNPFGRRGRIDDPAEFFDRDDLLRRIFEELGKGSSLSLVGEAQVGKSSLLTAICARGPQRLGLPDDQFIYLDMQLLHDENDFFEELCDRLEIDACRGGRLARALRRRGKRYILCIDEIERMCRQHFSGDEREELRGLADGAHMPFTLVIASRTPLGTLFPDRPERSSPLAEFCIAMDVPPFTPQVARDFIAARLHGTAITFAPAEVDHLLMQSGCHPARLQRAAADLYRTRTEAQ